MDQGSTIKARTCLQNILFGCCRQEGQRCHRTQPHTERQQSAAAGLASGRSSASGPPRKAELLLPRLGAVPSQMNHGGLAWSLEYCGMHRVDKKPTTTYTGHMSVHEETESSDNCSRVAIGGVLCTSYSNWTSPSPKTHLFQKYTDTLLPPVPLSHHETILAKHIKLIPLYID